MRFTSEQDVFVLRLFVSYKQPGFHCVRGPCHSPVYQWRIVLSLVFDKVAGAQLRIYGAHASASS